MSEDEQMALAIQMSLQTPGMYFTYICISMYMHMYLCWSVVKYVPHKVITVNPR